MRFLIGCSGAIAFIVFIIGFVVSLFVGEATWTERITVGAMPAAVVFIVVLLLFMRDSARQSASIRSTRNHLLACGDKSDDIFISSFSTDNALLLLETRKAIAQFFDVPTSKIARDVHLIDELHVDRLEPSFQFYVVNSVIASQPVEPKPFAFDMAGLESIDDLAYAIRKVIDGLKLRQ
ncbi:MAG: hypothetical protein JXM70_18190 [Pirellulales bacterium]|nr:hypothetical protein [Pirellulales bacterium]